MRAWHVRGSCSCRAFQVWDPRRGTGSSDFDPDELAERWIARVPQERMQAIVDRLETELASVGDLGPALRTLTVPLWGCP